MQQGRMKGQAFVGMPSEELALRALQDTNGYVLQGKPMVVVSIIIVISFSVSFSRHGSFVVPRLLNC